MKAFRINEELYRTFRSVCAMKGVSIQRQLEALIRVWTQQQLKEVAEKMEKQLLVQNA